MKDQLRKLALAATPEDGVTNRHMQVSVPLEDLLALLDEIERLRNEMDGYKKAVAAQLHFDMKQVLSGTPESRLVTQLAAVTAARDEACEIGQRHTRALRAIMPKADRISADDDRIAELRKVGQP